MKQIKTSRVINRSLRSIFVAMIDALFKYIEFLLPQYNCVIVPDFGGFVVNIEPAYYGLDGTIIAPSYKISFNPDLKHNDGLLASSMQKLEDISYETACKNIHNAVEVIRLHFTRNKTLQCGNLGKLIYNEGSSFSFVPSSQVIHPSLYGLTSVRMPLLSQIDIEIKKEKHSLNVKYTISAIVASIVALIVFVGSSVSVGNDSDNGKVQHADFIQSLIKNSPQIAPKHKVDEMQEPSSDTYDYSNLGYDNNSELNNTSTDQEKKTNDIGFYSEAQKNVSNSDSVKSARSFKALRTYYLIVGDEDTSPRAEKLLSKIQSSDFPQARIITSHYKHRIYIASFNNKQEAEAYLNKFKSVYPEYNNASLFSVRNIKL